MVTIEKRYQGANWKDWAFIDDAAENFVSHPIKPWAGAVPELTHRRRFPDPKWLGILIRWTGGKEAIESKGRLSARRPTADWRGEEVALD